MRTWSSHLDGAATLFGARGVDISNCTLGRKGLKLHLQLRSQTVCITLICEPLSVNSNLRVAHQQLAAEFTFSQFDISIV
jgi:hypothetical protein